MTRDEQDLAARIEIWRNEVYGNLKDTGKVVHETLDEIRLRPTRAEIEAMLATKLSLDVYNAESKAIREDIQELRDKPVKLQGWLGLVVAGGGCLVTVISVVLSTLLAVGALMLQHWHP